MIICCACEQGIAVHRKKDDVPERQIGAYSRHLTQRHGIAAEEARRIAKSATLLTVNMPANAGRNWETARRLWAENATVTQIAEEMGVEKKAMRTRIARWRRERGWFPVRVGIAD
jgi:uncharacterized membrane protein YqiK